MKNTLITLLTIILLAVLSAAFAFGCPLCVAAADGNVSEVERLLDNGADVNDEGKYGFTALIMGVEESSKRSSKNIVR